MTKVIHIRDSQKTPDEVYIGRPSKWGNPRKLVDEDHRVEVVIGYRDYLIVRPDLVKAIRTKLKDKTLVCYCKPKLCHGDVLAFVADGGDPKDWRIP